MLKTSVMQRAVSSVLVAVLCCFAAPKKYGDSKYWKMVQLKAANCYAADVGVPVVIGNTGMLDVIAGCSRSDGKDIVITDASGTLIPRDLAGFGKVATVKFQLWYKDPATSATTGGTVVYMQWGGGSVNVANDATTWANCYGGSTDHALVVHGEDAAANVTDASGNYTATDANITYAQTGKIRLAPGFNGNNSSINWGDVTQINSASKLTYNTWIRIADITAVDIIYNKRGAVTYQTDIVSSVIDLYFSDSDYATLDVSAIISNNVFFLLTTVYDGSLSGNANKLKLYIDGVQRTLTFSGTIPNTTPNVSGNNLTLGASSWGLEGIMDEFCVVAGALTANQISCQYDIQNGFATNATLTIGAANSFEDVGRAYIKLPYKNDAYKNGVYKKESFK